MKISGKNIFLTLGIMSLIIVIMGITSAYPSANLQKNNHPEITPTPTFSWDNYIIITETPIPTPTKKPTPTPTKTPTPIPPGAYEEWFSRFSSQYAVDRQLLKRIAICESGLNPNAKFGDYAGIFQFSNSAWQTARRTMNMDPNPVLRFNPEEAIKTAAFKLATGGRNSWPNCGK